MKRTLIYIYGLGYSGSTLLDWFLGTHPNMIGMGEVYGLLEQRHVDPKTAHCACEATMDACPFWMPVGARYETIRSGSVYKDRYRILLETLAKTTPEDTVLIDSSKRIESLKQIQQLGTKIDLRVIHIVRDARGQSSSTKRHRKRKGKFVNAPMALLNWLVKMWQFKRALKPLDVPMLTVSYNDLCEHPEDILNQVATFAGLEPAPARALDESQSHTIFGNPMRTDASRKTTITCNTRWTSDWSLRLWYWLLFPVAIADRLWNKTA